MIGEVRMFGGNFAPRSWAFCDGQLLAISQNQALFSILGTTYGGDGRTTFALPDLRGRVAIGSGRGPGLSDHRLGQRSGTQENTLTTNNLASHNHTATGNLQAAPGDGTTGVANGNSLAHQARGNSVPSIYNSGTPSVNLHANSGSVTLANNGQQQPVNNMAPSIGINYIIAMVGVFPSRS